MFFSQSTYGSTSVIACVLFPQTIHGSTSSVIACVLFPQTTHGSTTRVIECVFFPQITHGSTSVIACVFFPQITHGSTSGHCMCVLILKPTLELLHACSIHEPHLVSLDVCSFHEPQLESLHVCSFHKPHMDPPVVIACVFFPPTTHGSTSGHCMCVLSTNHLWINQWSLHVCSFHKPHVDPLESLHVCSYTKTSTRVIACVFFSQTTHGSTSGHCMCVLFTNHIWIH